MYWSLAKGFLLVKWVAIVPEDVEVLVNVKALEDLNLGLSSKPMEEEIVLVWERRYESRRGCPYMSAMGRA
jgi:hypothetical protein